MKNFRMGLKEYFTKENTVKFILTWLLFFILLILYVMYVVPIYKERISSKFGMFIYGFFSGFVMMVISQLLVRYAIHPIIKNSKLWTKQFMEWLNK
jgi:FtsH-binding integral membrane protein